MPEGTTDIYALDVAYGFAAEIGVLISVMALLEDYMAQLLAKLTNMEGGAAQITMGTFFNFSHRVDLLEHLAKNGDTDVKKDVLILVTKIRTANNLRVKYAHAKYSVGRDHLGRQTIHVQPFYGDARKKPKTEILYPEDVAADVETVKGVNRVLQGYLYRGERPNR